MNNKKNLAPTHRRWLLAASSAAVTVVLLASLANTLWVPHLNPIVSLNPTVSLSTPAAVTPAILRYSTPDPSAALTAAERDTRFAELESALQQLSESQSETLLLDNSLDNFFRTATTPYLEGLDASAAEIIPPATMTRLQWLIRQSLPTQAGEEFAELFPTFLAYHRAEAQLLAQGDEEASLEQEFARLDALIQLRERHLGAALTQSVYEGQHIIARYFLQVRALSENLALSEEDRQVQRDQLEADLRMQLKEPPEDAL